jgi:hypothetical protein
VPTGDLLWDKDISDFVFKPTARDFHADRDFITCRSEASSQIYYDLLPHNDYTAHPWTVYFVSQRRMQPRVVLMVIFAVAPNYDDDDLRPVSEQ